MKTGMIRKQVYIEKHHDRMLKRRAKQLGVTEAELIRKALDGVDSGSVARNPTTDAAAAEEALSFMRSLAASRAGASKEVEMGTAEVFRDGRSQAVRLPKEFRFEGEELSIRREGEAVILEPLTPQTWPKGYWQRWGKASRDLDLIEPLPPGGEPVDLDEP